MGFEDCVRLLDRGLEVRLYRAHPHEPLDLKQSKKTDKTRSRTAALLKMRLEATIYPGRKAKTKGWADDLDVDRGCIHDAKGRVRALITTVYACLIGAWKFVFIWHITMNRSTGH